MTADAPPEPASVRFTPEEVERAWVGRAKKRYGGTPGQSLARLAPAAGALSDLFTVDRPAAFEAYAENEEARLAYGVFFAPQTWVRTRFPLVEAITWRGWRRGKASAMRMLDLGAGLGSAGLSAAQLLRARGLASAVHVVAVDRSRESLADLRSTVALAPESMAGLSVETVEDDLVAWGKKPAASQAPFDLAIASFSVNEAFAGRPDEEVVAWMTDVLGLLGEDGLLLVVEPAQRAPSERLRTLAASILASGAGHLWGPDLAPTLAPPEPLGRFWDHEVRRWTAPKSVVAVNAVLRRSLRVLTFSYVLLGRRAPTVLDPTPTIFRLTSPIGRTHGRREWTGITSAGTRASYDLLERHLDDDAELFLKGLERGDVLRTRSANPHQVPDRFRVASAMDLELLHHPE